jgi:hypothetical protein
MNIRAYQDFLNFVPICWQSFGNLYALHSSQRMFWVRSYLPVSSVTRCVRLIFDVIDFEHCLL